MSVTGTSRFLRQIGQTLGLPRKRVEAAIGRELGRLKRGAELARRQLAGRRFAVFADAPRAAGVVASLTEVGAVPALIGVLYARFGDRTDVVQRLEAHHEVELPESVRWLADPDARTLQELDWRQFDVVVGTTWQGEWLADEPTPFVEFGFPSEQRHFVFPAPYLGYSGFARFVEQVMHATEDRLSAR
jgi:nitrogenase molybdenum-iron protein alpha/beta subunit